MKNNQHKIINNNLTPWETIDNDKDNDFFSYVENPNNKYTMNKIPLTIASQNLNHNNNTHTENPESENNILSQTISKAIIVASSGILEKIDDIKSENDAKSLLEEIQSFISSHNCNNINEILEKIERKIELLDQDGFYSDEEDANNQYISNILSSIAKLLKEKIEHSISSTPKSSKSGFSSGHSSYTNYNKEYQNSFITFAEKNDMIGTLLNISSAIHSNNEEYELESKIKTLKNDRELMQNSLNQMKTDKIRIGDSIDDIKNVLKNKNDDNFTQKVNELGGKLNIKMKSLNSIVVDKNNQYKWDFMKTFSPNEEKEEVIKYLNNKIINMRKILDGYKIPSKYSNTYKDGEKIEGLDGNISALKNKIEHRNKEIDNLEEKLRNNPIKYGESTKKYQGR